MWGKVMMNCKLKVMLLLTVLLLVGVPLTVKGGRELKDHESPTEKDKAVHPENFFGGIAGAGSLIPGTPAVGGATGFGTVPGLGTPAVDFCSVPGLGCVRVQPTNPGAGIGGVGGSSTPLPFP